MKEKAYIIPKSSPLFFAAEVSIILCFIILTATQAVYFYNHIPFFGNLVGDTYGFFVILLIEDILYFSACVLQVLGTLLARKNLWFLIAGWSCYLILGIFQYITANSGGISCSFLSCCILMMILAQTGNIHSRKAAVIPIIVCGAVYSAMTLPLAFIFGASSILYAAGGILQYASCALLMSALLWRNSVIDMPAPIVEIDDRKNT